MSESGDEAFAMEDRRGILTFPHRSTLVFLTLSGAIILALNIAIRAGNHCAESVEEDWRVLKYVALVFSFSFTVSNDKVRKAAWLPTGERSHVIMRQTASGVIAPNRDCVLKVEKNVREPIKRSSRPRVVPRSNL